MNNGYRACHGTYYVVNTPSPRLLTPTHSRAAPFHLECYHFGRFSLFPPWRRRGRRGREFWTVFEGGSLHDLSPDLWRKNAADAAVFGRDNDGAVGGDAVRRGERRRRRRWRRMRKRMKAYRRRRGGGVRSQNAVMTKSGASSRRRFRFFREGRRWRQE